MYPAAVRHWKDLTNHVFPRIAEIRAAFHGPSDTPERVARTQATFKYIFTTTKRGAFVLIRGGAVRLFVQLDAAEFRNAWSRNITGAPVGRPTRPTDSAGHAREFVLIEDPARWYANGGSIVDTWESVGDELTESAIKYFNMLTTLCRERRIPDCEFFVNDRDGPLLRRDRREPYSFAWPSGVQVPLVAFAARHYTPIVSYFTDPDIWEDAPGITLEEWELPDTSPSLPWDSKKDVLLWRGAATGFGVMPETNQRLRLATLRDLEAGIDVGIVSWNSRERLLPNAAGDLCLTMPDVARLMDLGIKKEDRVEAAAQATYKYVVYVDGHCAAARYPAMMRLGTVIFRVASVCNAGHLWFFSTLRGIRIPYAAGVDDVQAAAADHVIIDADFSNMRATLAWCRSNPAIAEVIVRNALARAPDRRARMDYMATLLGRFAAEPCGAGEGEGLICDTCTNCGNVAWDAEMARD